MIKKLLALALALFTAIAFAASVDVNKADQATLETVKGIGPAISAKILDERKKAPFKDWQDLVDRVKGIGETNAAKFSTAGLTVNGDGFKGAPPADKTEKPSGSKPPTKAKADKAAAASAPDAAAAPSAAASTDKAEKKSKKKKDKADAASAPASSAKK